MIVALKNGKTTYCGTPKEIIQPKLLKDIYNVDIQVKTINDVPIALYYR
ncbi:iron compound ABC transporter, ATP-binding protein [Bartonella henselae]|nr:hypothetical protein Q654_01292 [Bartonella henselae JK 50]ETS08958.1 hypothetical protein Q655_01245 [Bartonella henselae JK 51]CDO40634.1 iron compound ABC transporter, ATP-binding protein [Bartonella henselae]CUH91208.1 iron compound ABC transporter, ATP-binding protein [Bartonella henselae]